jgi:RNA polymerase sigma-70 factor, ECF subfamily
MIDERTFLAVYDEAARPLRAYAARVLGGTARADDIVQEAFLRLLRTAVPTTDARELRRYVFRIASNLIADHFRDTRRETSLDAEHERAAEELDLSGAIEMERVFARLQPRDRQLLWLAHVEGASHAEIAAALGFKQGSVAVLLFRARRALAQLLGDQEP